MGELNSGLFEYTTVWTREPNFHADGSTLTNVNTATAPTIQALLQNCGVANATSLGTQIYNYRTTPAGVRLYNNILDLAYQCQYTFGMSEADVAKIYNNVTTTNVTYFRGRVNVNTAGADVLTALFEGLNNNINEQTASSAAQTLITYRQQNRGNLNFSSWRTDALGSNNQVITALRASTANGGGGYVTTRSYQFTADIAA